MKERPILFSGPMVRAILEGRKTQTRRVVKHKGQSPPEWATFAQELSNISWNARLDKKNGLFRWSCAEDEGVQSIRRWPYDGRGGYAIPSPYGKPGDRLWVRETWNGTWHDTDGAENMHIAYAADGGEQFVIAPEDYVLPKAAAKTGGWVSPLFIKRFASRLLLEITDVRVERLQNISKADAIAEGIDAPSTAPTNITPWRNYLVKQPAGAYNFSTPQRSYMSLWDCINGSGSSDKNPWVWAITFKVVQP